MPLDTNMNPHPPHECKVPGEQTSRQTAERTNSFRVFGDDIFGFGLERRYVIAGCDIWIELPRVFGSIAAAKLAAQEMVNDRTVYEEFEIES
jgi:hypothetical protein